MRTEGDRLEPKGTAGIKLCLFCYRYCVMKNTSVKCLHLAGGFQNFVKGGFYESR